VSSSRWPAHSSSASPGPAVPSVAISGPVRAKASAAVRSAPASRCSKSRAHIWAAPIARAVQEAVRTLPTYTFTAESFPCPRAFVWFEEPITLLPGVEPAPLRALVWAVLAERRDPEGVPVLIWAFGAAEPRPAGVPIVQVSTPGWILALPQSR
jgi:hypothetical protein